MRGIGLLAAACIGLGAAQLHAQNMGDSAWTDRKCALFDLAVRDALRLVDETGLRGGFLARTREFIATGCTRHMRICPETGAELEFADLLTMMTMNEGMASSFVPFGCAE